MSDRPDFSPTAVNTSDRADWSLLQATDKLFNAAQSPVSFNAGASVIYTVPAGKTLYITSWTALLVPLAVENANLSHEMYFTLTDSTTGSVLIFHGGEGGLGLSLNRYIRIPNGHLMTAAVYSKASHVCAITLSLIGFEV